MIKLIHPDGREEEIKLTIIEPVTRVIDCTPRLAPKEGEEG